jgi:hypothetical protein
MILIRHRLFTLMRGELDGDISVGVDEGGVVVQLLSVEDHFDRVLPYAIFRELRQALRLSFSCHCMTPFKAAFTTSTFAGLLTMMPFSSSRKNDGVALM